MTCPLDSSTPGRCHWCNKTLKGRQTRWCSRTCTRQATANHRWTQAKATAKQAATHYECAICHSFVREVEVDHITPCRGKHGTWGCHHHQDNLRVLCKACHRTKTAADRQRGWQ